ncbi:hypothetical protein PMAYCL1PPCAC_27393, partial [Pristionchus mayeri]
KAPLPAAAKPNSVRVASQESVDALSCKVDAVMAMLSDVRALLQTLSLANPPPAPTSLAPTLDVARVVYESCSRVISDRAEYEDKETRAVVIGHKENLKEGAAADEKLIADLVQYSGSDAVKKAWDEKKISHHRHPPDRPPGTRPLKISCPDKTTRDALLSGIRGKPGRPSPFKDSLAFIRKDLTPTQLSLEKEARAEAMRRNLEARMIVCGVRDFTLINYRTPRPLPPRYGLSRTSKTSSADLPYPGHSGTPSSAPSAASIPSTPDPAAIAPSRTDHVTTSHSLVRSTHNRSILSTRHSRNSPVSVFYANARSIRCKSPQLSFLIASHEYRIICISETWLDNSDSDSLLVGGFPDFLPFRCDRVTSADYGRGGGVACLVHNSLNPILISTFSSPLVESCVVDIHLDYSPSLPYRKIRFFTIYRSPSAPNDSLIQLLLNLETHISVDFPCILIGDFNFPNVDWPSLSSPNQNDLLDFVSDHHFNQFVSFPSRLNSYLDLLFCNENIICNVSPATALSDHLSVTFDLRIPRPPQNVCAPSRNYRLADWISINDCIHFHDWTHALSNRDTHQSYTYFVAFLNNVLDTFVPLSKPSPFSRYPRTLKIIYGKCKTLTRVAPNSRACAIMTQRFNSALNRFHCSLENRIVMSSNPKLFYNYCKEKLSTPKTTPSGIVDSDGSVLTSNDQKCVAFEKFFSSVFSPPQSSPLPLPSPSFIFDLPSISYVDVICALSKLAPKVNVTPDTIPSIVLSRCRLSVVSPLLTIFNKSLLTSQPSNDPSKCIIKDLGVHFSPSLSFSSHISKIISKAHVRCSLPPISYKHRLHELNLMTLERRRFIIDILFLHSIIHSRYSLDISSLLTRAPLTRPLRNAHPLRISLPFIPNNSCSTLVSRTMSIWNALPIEYVSSSHSVFSSYIRSQPPTFYPPSIIATRLDL